MDKKIAGLLGSVAALTAIGAAQAAPSDVKATDALQASSYADLLAPIPNAQELLIADDSARATKPAEEMQLAQVTLQVGHHHHHHHRYHRKVIVIKRHHRRHHHHHHHHHSNYMAIPRANG